MYSSTARRGVSFLYFFCFYFRFGKNSLLLNSKKGKMENARVFGVCCLTAWQLSQWLLVFHFINIYIFNLFFFLREWMYAMLLAKGTSPFGQDCSPLPCQMIGKDFFFQKKPYCALIGRIFSLTLHEVSNRAFKYSEELFSEWINLKEPSINTKEFIKKKCI